MWGTVNNSQNYEEPIKVDTEPIQSQSSQTQRATHIRQCRDILDEVKSSVYQVTDVAVLNTNIETRPELVKANIPIDDDLLVIIQHQTIPDKSKSMSMSKRSKLS